MTDMIVEVDVAELFGEAVTRLDQGMDGLKRSFS